MTTQEAFFVYVREHCAAPDGGTAGSYRTALNKLKTIFESDKPEWVVNADVWAMTNPSAIMSLYYKIKDEQIKFKHGGGVFSPYSGPGDSYYKKGWCSAALRYFAQFRSAEKFDPKFDKVLNSSDDGLIVSAHAQKIDLGDLKVFLPDDIDITTKEGKEIVKSAKQRIGQQQFRKWVLGIYGGKCCVTGLDVPQVLRASHIVAWADDAKNRMNPSNGLCLSATYDAAFDQHLISFDDDYRMVLSKSLHEHCTKQVLRDYFLFFEGKSISMPAKFAPDLELLAKHRNKLVA